MTNETSMDQAAELDERIASVRERIARAAQAVGRDPAGVRIVAVTKTHPVATARAAVAAGLHDLGENRVDELAAKSAEVDARWHLVGRLQSNKAKDVVGRAALIHSVDRRSLVDIISRHAQARGVVQDILVQVNVGEDPAKGGCSLAGLADLVSYASVAPGVRVVGLMTVPPLPEQGVAPSDAARPLFRALREARDALRTDHATLEELSMGMSDDLEAAVQEDATMVRIGSALFGARGEVGR
jgi:pyridoxal phosphate enzyme (YggS family)